MIIDKLIKSLKLIKFLIFRLMMKLIISMTAVVDDVADVD